MARLVSVVGTVVIVLLLAFGVTSAEEDVIADAKPGDGKVLVELLVEPSIAKVGENRVTVYVKDAATGQGVPHATVVLEVEAGDVHVHRESDDHSLSQDARHSADATTGHGSGSTTTGDHGPTQAGDHAVAPASAGGEHAAHESAVVQSQAPAPAEAHGSDHSLSSSTGVALVNLAPTAAPGEYVGQVHLDRAGSWQAKVLVSVGGVDETQTFGLRVASAGPNWLLLGGITAPILLTTAIAVARRKRAEELAESDGEESGEVARLLRATTPSGPTPRNLLDNPLIRRVFESRLYPGVLQYATVLVFAVVVYELLLGPASAHDNFGTAMTWVLWWPLIPLFFLLLGRFWCAICPFATLSDFIQKVVGRNKAVPPFLKKYGIWIIDAAFILITWADHTLGIVESPRGSGVLLVLLILGVVTAGTVFERRTWCRYLCFLGGLSGNYSRAGAMELRATPSVCATCKAQACYRGNEKAPGCPMFEFPRSMDTNARCNLCGYCVKSCPNDSIRVSLRLPTRELWSIRKPKFEESFLACVIMGVVFVQNITMLEIWKPILSWLERALGTTSYFVTFTVTFGVMMLVPILALLLASFFAGRGNGRAAKLNFTLFGYALIPLDLAGHLAHNLFHLLAEGKSVLFTALGLFGTEIHGSAALVDEPTIQMLQYMLILLGTAGSLYTAYRIARSRPGESASAWNSALPLGALIAVLGVVNLVLFYLPMEMRM